MRSPRNARQCAEDRPALILNRRVAPPRRQARVDPPDQKTAIWRVTDIDFSRDPGQTCIHVMDLGSGKVRRLDRKTGQVR